MKTLEQINQEIEALKQEAEELETAKNRPNYALEDFADKLHSAVCMLPHDLDHCGYEYYSWDNPGYSKETYMKRAKMIDSFLLNNPRFNGVSLAQLIHVINVAANG